MVFFQFWKHTETKLGAFSDFALFISEEYKWISPGCDESNMKFPGHKENGLTNSGKL